MKTSIQLSDYKFSGKNNPKFQISDDPKNKLVRVLEIDRAEYLFDVDMIRIQATTHYINPELKLIVFTAPTTVEQKPWDIVKGDKTIKIDANFHPVPNPDFDPAKDIDRETNYPYLLTDAYEQFKAASVALNMPMLNMFVASNDDRGLYD